MAGTMSVRGDTWQQHCGGTAVALSFQTPMNTLRPLGTHVHGSEVHFGGTHELPGEPYSPLAIALSSRATLPVSSPV